MTITCSGTDGRGPDKTDRLRLVEAEQSVKIIILDI